MKRIVTVQDISAVGKCSLTVALPIISACGVECAVMPTAVLSTHTQFSGFTFHDLTDEIAPITRHWESEGLTFDAIYTGYLGSFRQIELVEEMHRTFGSTLVVDPAMADHGKLYYGFTEDFAKRMAQLCGKADAVQCLLQPLSGSRAAFRVDRLFKGTRHIRGDDSRPLPDGIEYCLLINTLYNQGKSLLMLIL